MISGNIVDGAARGISIANLDHGGRLSVCSNNLVRNIHENVPYDKEQHIFGIGILVEADIAVTGNVSRTHFTVWHVARLGRIPA